MNMKDDVVKKQIRKLLQEMAEEFGTLGYKDSRLIERFRTCFKQAMEELKQEEGEF